LSIAKRPVSGNATVRNIIPAMELELSLSIPDSHFGPLDKGFKLVLGIYLDSYIYV